MHFFAMVFALDHDGLTHFVDPRTGADADPVFERFIAVICPFVEVIGGKDRKFAFVIARVDDVVERIADPVGRL